MSLMIQQRFFTLLLLAFYGIPAALGPHWHHHGQCCAPAQCDSDCEPATANAQTQKENAALGCHCCEHSSAAKPATDFLTSTAFSSQPSADEHECAICAYYGKASFVQRLTTIVTFAPLVTRLAVISSLCEQHGSRVVRARGPPMTVIG